MASFPRVTHQLPGGELTALAPVHHGRGSVVLTGIDAYPGTALPSLHAMLLPKLPSVDLIPHSTVSGQGTHVTKNNCYNGPHSWNSLLIHVPTILSSWPDGMVEQPFEDSAIAPAR